MPAKGGCIRSPARRESKNNCAVFFIFENEKKRQVHVLCHNKMQNFQAKALYKH